jgi:hypothetical protein
MILKVIQRLLEVKDSETLHGRCTQVNDSLFHTLPDCHSLGLTVQQVNSFHRRFQGINGESCFYTVGIIWAVAKIKIVTQIMHDVVQVLEILSLEGPGHAMNILSLRT